MRIIRGIYKGKRITPPKGFHSRPTTDFAKESLFNILEYDFDLSAVRVLDLFTGTGSISLEFLSRGCKALTAVEKNKYYAFHIKNQFDLLFPGRANMIINDAFRFCKHAELDYDIIFADPPFKETKTVNLPDIILRNSSLNTEALIIIEHPKEIDFKDHIYFKEMRKYGDVHFSLFKKK